MGVSKTEIFTPEQNKIAQFAKVLGHPARVAILQELFNSKTCVCNNLVDEIGLAQSTISQHLKELKLLDIIKGTVEGTSVCYCINPSTWNDMQETLSYFLDQKLTNNTDCC